MKKILAVLTATALLATSLAGCSNASSSTESSTPSGNEANESEPVTLHFMLNSPENTDAYNAMAAQYHTEFPNVTIEMDILQNDYQTVLTTKLNSGNVPDLFMTSAYSDNTTYKDYIYDITNESFVKSIDPALLSSVSVDGKVTGYPFLVQAHSFIYNKDLFEQAGITTLPKTLDEYKAVCEKLNAINIQPFSSGFGEWWVMPQTTYPSMSDAYEGDYTKLFSDVQSGTLNFGDLPQVDYALDLLDLIKDNSGKKPMESTFDVQVSDMASGKVAMIHQGTWAEGSIRAISPDINIGFLQAPRMDGKDVTAVESNLTFRVAKDSKNRDEVLKFLDWLSTSDYGKKWVPEVVKQNSPLTGAPAPDTQLAKDTAAAQASGNVCSWWIFNAPSKMEQPFGEALQAYAAGSADREQTKAALTKVFKDAYQQ
jgi:raffinose/stachyose/melibiose transport system substrate-binding protein